MKRKFIGAFLTASLCVPGVSVLGVHADQEAGTTVTGNFGKAVSEIKVPKYDADGKLVNQGISADLQSHLDTANLIGTKDDAKKRIQVDVQLKGVDLTSDYMNGKSEAGISYYNMLNYFTKVKQVKQMLDANPGYTALDSEGNTVDGAYVNELLGLLQQINDFDPDTNLIYDWDSAYDTAAFAGDTSRGATDVIATSKEGNVTLRFHIDSHGWWGYDLGAHDSITGLVMGEDAQTAYDHQHVDTMAYANFFKIRMGEDASGSWYMLNDTDLQNPMIYLSKDGTEAFMIDVDFYGANVLNDKIKAIIGDNCKSLKIFMTHNHGDHVNNLAVIGKDDTLRNMTTILWPENEPHTVLTDKDTTEKGMVGKDLISDIAWGGGVTTLKDMETFKAAGSTFQFIEIPNEHTPGGGQLADLTHKVIYSGDSLGAQVHLGGTTVQYDNIDNWLAGANKAAEYIKANGIRYNIGGHTPYVNNPNFASWLATALEYGKENTAEPEGDRPNMNLVIAENGQVVNGTDRYGEIMANGLSDRGELAICSVNILRTKKQAEPTTDPGKQEEEKPTDTDKQDNTSNTSTDTKTTDTKTTDTKSAENKTAAKTAKKETTSPQTGVNGDVTGLVVTLVTSAAAAGALVYLRIKH